jgi:GT2 family glycosyltransferase
MGFEISVIVLSYNSYEGTTGPCLQSLIADEENRKVEIIVIDNGSTGDTPAKLKRAVKGHDNIRLILNSTNRGFAGGNNDGAAIASGDVLILLNSDTVVPGGSLTMLGALMQANPDWAMLGPVSNQAGNEQKIFTKETAVERVLHEGEVWCSHSRKDAFLSERLDFFCVAIRKDIYDRFGGLDEQFGAGYYEDTDFSLQVKQAGLKMMFTEEVFVYHQAGKSFSRKGKAYVKKLMQANRKKLKNKYGRRVDLHHMRDCNLYVLDCYASIASKQGGVVDPDLEYKFLNRVEHARTLLPGSPLKKLKYKMQLNKICRRFATGGKLKT